MINNPTDNDLIDILLLSKSIKNILDNTYELHLPNWYLAGGGISQTVWNYLTDHPLESNISDYDLSYFDDEDLTSETEEKIQLKTKELFLGIKVEIVNEARVHFWYKKY